MKEEIDHRQKMNDLIDHIDSIWQIIREYPGCLRINDKEIKEMDVFGIDPVPFHDKMRKQTDERTTG